MAAHYIRTVSATKHTQAQTARKNTHSNFDVRKRLPSGESGGRERSVGRDGDDVRAVDERARVLAEDGQLCHHRLELSDHGGVVACEI